MPKPYAKLTTLGQARRLRPLVMNALAQYDLQVASLQLISNDLNGIFRIDTTSRQRCVLRVTVPEGGHTREHVLAEMDWLAALAEETSLLVPRPLPARDGTLFVEAAAPGVPEPRLCAVFRWVPGRDLADALDEDTVYKLGALMARLHQHAASYRTPTHLELLRFDRVFPFPEPVVLFDDAHAAIMPPARREVFQQGINRAQAAIDGLLASGEPMRMLHGDLHQWNVRISRGQLAPIDFEDLMLGWPVQDIATSLYYFPQDNFQAMRQAFRRGYEQVTPWPERRPGEIEAFIAARGLGLANFVLNDPNPEWRYQAADFLHRTEQRLLGLFKTARN